MQLYRSMPILICETVQCTVHPRTCSPHGSFNVKERSDNVKSWLPVVCIVLESHADTRDSWHCPFNYAFLWKCNLLRANNSQCWPSCCIFLLKISFSIFSSSNQWGTVGSKTRCELQIPPPSGGEFLLIGRTQNRIWSGRGSEGYSFRFRGDPSADTHLAHRK